MERSLTPQHPMSLWNSEAERQAAFQHLTGHADYARAQSTPPADSLESSRKSSEWLFGLVLILVLGGLLVLGTFFLCPPLGLVPLVGIALLLHTYFGARRTTDRRPAERVPAYVAAQGTSLAGSGGGTRTDHLTTLEFANGEQRELRTPVVVARALRTGSGGLAGLRGHELVSFDPVVPGTVDPPPPALDDDADAP